MKVKANRVVAYGGTEHALGDEFEMNDKEAKVFIVAGRVSEVHEAPQAKVTKPEEEARDTLHPKKKKPKHEDDTGKADKDDKGRYKRRDVRAEDDEHTREGED